MKSRGMAIVAALAVAACAPPVTDVSGPRAVLVRTVAAGGGGVAVQVYTGEVRARYETDLAFRIGGKVIERRVDVGATVRRGQVLARLDPQDAKLAVAAAAAQVAAAEADAVLARAELERAQGLRAQGFISASALDARKTSLEAAQARLRQARAEAAVSGNQAAYADLAADADGVVTAVAVEVGQVLAAGQSVLRVARPGEREVLVHVPESRLREVAVGAAVHVRSWSAPEREFVGRVREVAPAADAATRTYAVRVAVAQADDALPLGSTASVAVAQAASGQTLLPLSAVGRIDAQPVVWVVGDDDTVRPLAVEVEAFREDGVVVRAGLPAQVRIVVAGIHRLVAGETVRAIAEGAPVALDVQR